MHKILRQIFVLAFITVCISQTGCEPYDYVAESNGEFENGTVENASNSQSEVIGNQTGVQNSNLVMGSFNIQMFGKTKMSRPDVVEVLVDIVRRFDILAVQELRDGDEWVVREFLEQLNEGGYQYAASVGPKQGYRVNGKLARYYEQAIFFYDTTKVEMISQGYVAEDQYGIMHRAPYVGHFRTKTVSPDQAFSFVLMNVHTDPDDAHVEFGALRDIIAGVYANHRGEDDFILIGDLNDEPSRYSKYGWMQSQFSAIPSTMKTNTIQKSCYDNLVFNANLTAEYTQSSGVLNLMEEYGLSVPEARRVSDHMPVWAYFSPFEAPRAAMTQSASQEVIR